MGSKIKIFSYEDITSAAEKLITESMRFARECSVGWKRDMHKNHAIGVHFLWISVASEVLRAHDDDRLYKMTKIAPCSECDGKGVIRPPTWERYLAETKQERHPDEWARENGFKSSLDMGQPFVLCHSCSGTGEDKNKQEQAA